MSDTLIDGKKHILLPISVVDTAGEEIHKAFFLGARHLDYVKAQSFVMLWVKRGIFTMKNKADVEFPAYALTVEEYKFFTQLFNDAKLPF